MFKRLRDTTKQKECLVIATPEVHHLVVKGDDRFVILACDGIWDVMTSQEACNYVWRRLHVHKNIEQAACDLVSHMS